MNKILIFGGTTEGRLAAQRLSAAGCGVTVSVATPLGAEALTGIRPLTVTVGRKNRAEMLALMRGFDLCIDATHPYAREASETIAAAAALAGLPLYRLLRPSGGADADILCADAAEAARFLAPRQGNILLTTGTNTLPAFAALDPARLYVRVLPTHQALDVCESLGLSHSHIIAMQGPFSAELNLALLHQYEIRWLVSKDGGRPGGWQEKREAARAAGAKLVLLRRSEEQGWDFEELIQEVLRQCGKEST